MVWFRGGSLRLGGTRGARCAAPVGHTSLQRKEQSELLYLIAAILFVLISGILGFSLTEGWGLFDSLYMTIITLSTVGYHEVHPLSLEGRVVAMVLIVVGVGVAMYVLTTLAHKVIDRQIIRSLRGDRMQELIDQLEQHTVLCGFGRLARFAAHDLQQANAEVVVIEQDEESAAEAEEAGFFVVRGDSTEDEVLESAGIRRANRLVSLLPKDADNLYVILTSREMNSNLYILSRAEDAAGEKRLRRAGANRVVSPYRAGGQRIASVILRPYVTDFIELAASTRSGELVIEEIRIPTDSPLGGVSLAESGLRQKANIIIAAVISVSGEMEFNPSGATVLQSGSTLIGLGALEDFRKLEDMLLGTSDL